jgi:UDP-N-acetylglucosamine--N-acetylmuramyl-(pentapeptide) pyrophosphoryl-undecaprenol N-acetylglucosamine transferase
LDKEKAKIKRKHAICDCMRLLFACSELGLGHVSRIIPLGKRLEKNGHEAFFFSGGRAFELLKKEFKHVYKVTPIAWYENGHGIVTSASMLNILLPLPLFNMESNKLEIKSSNAMETIHRYYDLRQNIRDISPDVLIADGDINALRLALRWKIPSVYIANVIRPSYGFQAILSLGERFIERYIRGCSKIVIPDNPPPYTVSEYNIGDLANAGFEGKIEYVGAFVDTTYMEGSEEHIFAPISGPVGTRSRLIKTLLPVIENAGKKAIISLGVPGKKSSAKIGNCELHNWLSTQEREEIMRNSKYVLFSGGHITSFETIKYAKPTICLPTQPEQGGNAAKLQDLGCSIKVKNQKELAKAIKQMDLHYDVYKKNVLTLNAFSSKFRGLDRAVAIVEEVLD